MSVFYEYMETSLGRKEYGMRKGYTVDGYFGWCFLFLWRDKDNKINKGMGRGRHFLLN